MSTERHGGTADAWKVVPLGEGGGTVWTSPDPSSVRGLRPSLIALQSGRLAVALDQVGPGVKALPGTKGQAVGRNRWVQGLILTSSDDGAGWSVKDRYPFSQAVLFVDGSTLYALGHDGGALQIQKSANGGETWGKPVELIRPDEGEIVDGPGNVWVDGETVASAVMVRRDAAYRGDPASVLAPVVLQATPGSALTNVRAWSRSGPAPAFRDLVAHDDLRYFGVPFFDVPQVRQGERVGRGAWANRVGWREAHVVRVRVRGHAWADASGRTLHLIARAHSHRGDLAALGRVDQDEHGAWRVGLQDTPAGRPWAFTPIPGGSRPFALLFDPPSDRFWLVSHQMRNQLSRPGRVLPGDRRGPLHLCFSRNLVDWAFAGLIDVASAERSVGQDPAIAVCGDNLVVVTRVTTRGENEDDRRDSILCRLVPHFRDLVY